MKQVRGWRDLLVEAARIFLFVVGCGFVIVITLGTLLFFLASLFLPVDD
jgi:hypothetical protein